ncbi:aldo/keto reductase [Streptomyces corynorhini]|uniref:Aldo/keto reductase n=1 Tax=Streptomyces corynorhini TaxID=2282652 RepID=A0A370B8T3_9ACTN|nr:aldo/keto reductase [Streptomyces corynorhini]RDG36779.1 aldo/keto reductase [Streptomyces corynorhini]
MQYRTLGNSGVLVSNLALGTMNFGTPETSQEEAFAQLDAFVEAGGNLIDTADVYNGGIAEATVGQWLAARPRDITDRAVIATKGRVRTGDDVNDAGLSRRHLDRALTTSLRRLGTDTVDLYQVHAWDPLTPVGETLSFLDSAVRAGKIRYVGLSNFTGWQLQLAVSTARAHGYEAPVSLQAQYNLATRETEWEMLPAARHNGLGVLAWSPLASGFLTGKYTRDTERAPDTRAGEDHALYRYTSSNYETSDRTWSAVEAVRRVADDTGATPAQVALSWVANRPGVVSAIVGARTLQQLTGSLSAADLRLAADALTTLDAASDPAPAPYPYGPFGSAQRHRATSGPEALGALIEAHAEAAASGGRGGSR